MNIDEIREEIAKLEGQTTTYGNVEKLALLYTVNDHLNKPEPQPTAVNEYSFADEPKSEFWNVASSVPIDVLLSVMDEHMDAIKVLYPKEYQAVIRKIRNA